VLPQHSPKIICCIDERALSSYVSLLLPKNKTMKLNSFHIRAQGRRQNIFQGGRGQRKRPKISKKYRKIALFSLFQGGRGNGKKDLNITKKAEK